MDTHKVMDKNAIYPSLIPCKPPTDELLSYNHTQPCDHQELTHSQLPTVHWCVALHLASPCAWPMIRDALTFMSKQISFDLYINMVQQYKWSEQELDVLQVDIKNQFSLTCPRIVIEKHANHDVDIGGFFNTLYTILSSFHTYKYIFKIHTKTNLVWLKSILLPLAMGLSRIDQLYETDETVGMVGVSNWLFECPDQYDGGCFNSISHHLDQLHYPHLSSQQYGFFAGTIFTMRISILQQWIDLMGQKLNPLQYPRQTLRSYFEDIPRTIHTYDAWLHAIERLFGVLVTRSGYSIRGVNHPLIDEPCVIRNGQNKILSNIYVDKPLIIENSHDSISTALLTQSQKPKLIIDTHCSFNFDVVWYLMHNVDVSKAFAGPRLLHLATQHWLSFGIYEGRLPNAHYNTAKKNLQP